VRWPLYHQRAYHLWLKVMDVVASEHEKPGLPVRPHPPSLDQEVAHDLPLLQRGVGRFVLLEKTETEVRRRGLSQKKKKKKKKKKKTFV